MIDHDTTSLCPVPDLHSGQSLQPKRFTHPESFSALTRYTERCLRHLRLVVFSAPILRLGVQERKTINGDDASSVKCVVKAHILHIRELL